MTTRPVRIAIVGCGGYAGYHAGSLAKREDAQLVACVDVDRAIVDRFIDQHAPHIAPRPAVFTELPDMLATVRPGAVLIATPHTFHYEHVAAALNAGCHVFVEKPMVTRAADAYALKRKVADTGKVLVVGYNTPCTGEFDYLRQRVRDPHGPDGLGELQLVTGYMAQNWMHWTEGKWRQDAALAGGGFLYDSGAHILNSLCWSVESRVAEVFAFLDNRDRPIDINAAVAIRFENGVLATLAGAGDCAAQGNHMTFCFAGGRIDIDGWYGSWLDVHNAFGRVKYPNIDARFAGQTPLMNFLDAVQGKAEPRSGVEHGIIQCELMDAIYESAQTGRPAKPVST